MINKDFMIQQTKKITAMVLMALFLAETIEVSAFSVESSAEIRDLARIHGQVESTWTGHPERGHVYFIQDAHDSIEAQKNIAAIIAHGVQHWNVNNVFEEGYEGEVPVDKYFSDVEPVIKKRASEYYLDQLWIGGAEYARIHANQKFRLIGAEDEDLYVENLRQYQEASRYQALVANELESLRQPIQAWAAKNWNREQKQIYDIWSKHAAGATDFLTKAWRFVELLEKKKIETECTNFFLSLKKGQTPENLSINRVIHEEGKLETEVVSAYFSEATAEAFQHLKHLELLVRLNRFEVGAEDFKQVTEVLRAEPTRQMVKWIAEKSARPVLLSSAWETLVFAVVDFYEIAHRRDEAVLANLKTLKPEENAILVFGGFHRENLTALMEKAGISYTVVTPRISELSAKHSELYRERMKAPIAQQPSAAMAARSMSGFLHAELQLPMTVADPFTIFDASGEIQREFAVRRSEHRASRKVKYKDERPVIVFRSIMDHSLMDPFASYIMTIVMMLERIRHKSHDAEDKRIHDLVTNWLFRDTDLNYRRDDYSAAVKKHLSLTDEAASRESLTRVIQHAQRLLSSHANLFQDVLENEAVLTGFFNRHSKDLNVSRFPLEKLIRAAREAKAIALTQKLFLQGKVDRQKTNVNVLLEEIRSAALAHPRFAVFARKIEIAVEPQLEFEIDARLVRRSIGEMFKNSVAAHKKQYPQMPEKFIFKISAKVSNKTQDLNMYVQDQSGGIPESYLKNGQIPGRPKIFDTVFSTSNGGIGLAEAWHVVHDHRGSIDVRILNDDSRGVGTLFALHIPKVKARSETRDFSKKAGYFLVGTTAGVFSAWLTYRYQSAPLIFLFGIYVVGDYLVNTVAFRLSSVLRGRAEDNISVKKAFHMSFLFLISFLPAFFYQPWIAQTVDGFQWQFAFSDIAAIALKVTADLLITGFLYYGYLFLEEWRGYGTPWKKAFYSWKDFTVEYKEAALIWIVADIVAYTAGSYLGDRMIPVVTSVIDLAATTLVLGLGYKEEGDSSKNNAARSESRIREVAGLPVDAVGVDNPTHASIKLMHDQITVQNGDENVRSELRRSETRAGGAPHSVAMISSAVQFIKNHKQEMEVWLPAEDFLALSDEQYLEIEMMMVLYPKMKISIYGTELRALAMNPNFLALQRQFQGGERVSVSLRSRIDAPGVRKPVKIHLTKVTHGPLWEDAFHFRYEGGDAGLLAVALLYSLSETPSVLSELRISTMTAKWRGVAKSFWQQVVYQREFASAA